MVVLLDGKFFVLPCVFISWNKEKACVAASLDPVLKARF